MPYQSTDTFFFLSHHLDPLCNTMNWSAWIFPCTKIWRTTNRTYYVHLLVEFSTSRSNPFGVSAPSWHYCVGMEVCQTWQKWMGLPVLMKQLILKDQNGTSVKGNGFSFRVLWRRSDGQGGCIECGWGWGTSGESVSQGYARPHARSSVRPGQWASPLLKC